LHTPELNNFTVKVYIQTFTCQSQHRLSTNFRWDGRQ